MGRLKRIRESDESGLTLIEILAALVILGIVFIGFMSIFPQMTTFNKVTETKLKTMNIARQELADIQSNLFISPLDDTEILSKIGENPELYTSPSSPGETIGVRYDKDGYSFQSDFWISADLKSEENSKSFILHKVHVKVIVDGNINSETYGYIKAKEEAE